MPCDWISPQWFSGAPASKAAAEVYLTNPSTQKLVEFFVSKGLRALKEEDRREQWYDDWLKYQASHQLYASVLPRQDGAVFDLPAYARLLEVFGYFSPAHGYSLHVTSLALFAILLGDNAELKREAFATLESGGVLAFGVSEKEHGSDLLANEFSVCELGPDKYVASGNKYYIGNANAASMIVILARTGERRLTPVLLALRPEKAKAFGDVRKIRTLGVRSAFVGEFAVDQHEFTQNDLIASGRDAWDALFGAITLGKFFLPFGSIGICEHAMREAAEHLNRRILYGKPAIEMPHLRFAMAQAYARLSAMKLYAYRAVDYVQAATATDRRYLLYCAVQKAMVSTEGVKVMALLSECIGAKGFESDGFFEMALRDVQLFPGLEGSTHVNLSLTAQFIPRYFHRTRGEPPRPKSLADGQENQVANPYLFEARAGGVASITFGQFLKSLEPLTAIYNVRLFTKQAKAFQLFIRNHRNEYPYDKNEQANILLGQCLATIAYAQLIGENAVLCGIQSQIIATIFHLLINDLTSSASALASSGLFESAGIQRLVRRATITPQTSAEDWTFVASQLSIK